MPSLAHVSMAGGRPHGGTGSVVTGKYNCNDDKDGS